MSIFSPGRLRMDRNDKPLQQQAINRAKQALIFLTFVRAHFTAARVLVIGTRLSALIGLQQMIWRRQNRQTASGRVPADSARTLGAKQETQTPKSRRLWAVSRRHHSKRPDPRHSIRR